MLVATSASGLFLLGLVMCLSLTDGAPGSPIDQEWTNFVDSPMDHSSDQSPVSFSHLLKALFRLNLLRKSKYSPSSEVLPDTAATSEPTSSAEDDLIPSTSPPPLVDDTPDLWHIPGHLERDKSHKFTHSFRFGYGAPH
uniref:Uncharacterized protein n=1 Tax=Graphocephala atropunctata TaxID=36148 RepID=A0A1B6LM73_9HEMI